MQEFNLTIWNITLFDLCSHRFPCSIGSNQHSQRSTEGDDLYVFILNPKAPHPQDAHLVNLGHFSFFLRERKKQILYMNSIKISNLKRITANIKCYFVYFHFI